MVARCTYGIGLVAYHPSWASAGPVYQINILHHTTVTTAAMQGVKRVTRSVHYTHLTPLNWPHFMWTECAVICRSHGELGRLPTQPSGLVYFRQKRPIYVAPVPNVLNVFYRW